MSATQINSSTLLTAEHLAKRFGDVIAVKDLVSLFRREKCWLSCDPMALVKLSPSACSAAFLNRIAVAFYFEAGLSTGHSGKK